MHRTVCMLRHARRAGAHVRAMSTRTCGLVGLPNVGKSTLFNALCSAQLSQAANYPFCTIDPSSALVEVPDERLTTLQKLAGSESRVPTRIEFTDTAGLVKGASAGAGLGNQFLAVIRDVSVVLHVVRCFDDPDIVHVDGSVDPLRDVAVIENELVLSDLERVESLTARLAKKSAKKPVPNQPAWSVLQPVLELCAECLGDGRRAADVGASLASEHGADSAEVEALTWLGLLSAKPQVYVCNVDEMEAAEGNELTQQVASSVGEDNVVVVCARLEEECASLQPELQREMLGEFGLVEPGLHKVVRASSRLLGLQSFYTVGPQEARAWSIPIGCNAADAAGTIHSDFKRGFIRAETTSYDDYVALGGGSRVKEAGKLRLEGKDYVVQDGDVMLFRFNV